MKKELAASLTLIILAGVSGLAVPSPELKAQEPAHQRYRLADLGTFGGPNSFLTDSPVVQSVNSHGVVVGGAETPAPDPLAPNRQDPNCLILHAFEWRHGRLSAAGRLP